MGVVTSGPNVLPVARGVLGVGLKVGGTAKKSGEASGVTTTAAELAFDLDDQIWSGRQAVLIRMRAVGQTLAIGLGDKAATETLAADTWSSWLPCTALFEDKDSWWVTGGATAALEYEVAYV